LLPCSCKTPISDIGRALLMAHRVRCCLQVNVGLLVDCGSGLRVLKASKMTPTPTLVESLMLVVGYSRCSPE
jgi:hypothetical protein